MTSELTRAVNAGCGFACTIHANSARDALTALVNAAVMAGENVTESIVRRVFSSSIDFVIHLERDMRPHDNEGIRRKVKEILTITPALATEEFTTEPLFLRENLAGPLRWTGTLPPAETTERIELALPAGVDLKSIMAGSWRPHF